MNLMDLVTARVRILYEGRWSKNQVKIMVDDAYLPQVSEEMKIIAQARFAERKAKNPRLFDGDAFHLNLRHSLVRPNSVLLAIGKIKYSIYDIARKEYAEKYGWKVLPTGMGTCVVILTSDLKIVMHHRSTQVDHAAKLGIIGGIYSGEPPFEDIKEELKEELRLEKGEIKKLFLLGLYTRLDERVNHGLSFFVETNHSSQIILKKEKLLDKEEKEGKIFFLEKDREVLYDYLIANHRQILSDSFVGLVLAGRYLWGKNWSKMKNGIK